ncbi:MAG: CoA-binding protein [Sandaracinus sp.]|nr:CoA-binding protein [Sandaracinus sp.]MCB9633634.1 CoA-binding protein [Sandaracinus sp.]
MARIVDSDSEIRSLAASLRRIAVLGIKPDDRTYEPAHYVPAKLQRLGVEIVPVPTRYPEVDVILGVPVQRDLRAVGAVDLVCVFRRTEDLPPHEADLVALGPPAVWLQSGIRDDAFAGRLVDAGIDVVQSRCLMVERMRG